MSLVTSSDSVLPTPPSTPSPAPNSNISLDKPDESSAQSSLLDRIDTLLTTYLSAVHTYTTSNATLNASLRTAYFDLMRANTSATGSGLGGRGYGEPRYGTKAFDVRPGKMESLWEISWEKQEDSKGEGSKVWIEKRRMTTSRGKSSEAKAEDSEGKRAVEMVSKEHEKDEKVEEKIKKLNLDSTTTKDGIKNYQAQSPPTNTPDEAIESTQKKAAPKDPIYKLGGLVPPSLRAAQSSFAGAVRNNVPEILSAIAEMRQLEAEIRSLREQLATADAEAREEEKGKDDSVSQKKRGERKDENGEETEARA